MPRVVILIPSYNCASTIGETLASILKQRDLSRLSAVYIADNCSTDDTVSVSEAAWSDAGVPMRFLERKVNLGQAGSTNRAFEELKEVADWVLILHADDLAKPDWLGAMVARIDSASPRLGSICSSWDNLLPDGSAKEGEDDARRPVESIPGEPAAVRSTLLRGCWWHISGCAIRLDTFTDVGGFDPELPNRMDFDWLLRCLHGGWAVEYIPRTLIFWREHHASTSSQVFKYDRDIHDSFLVYRRFRRFLGFGDRLRICCRSTIYCVRRFARACVRLDARRMFRVIQTAVSVQRIFWTSFPEAPMFQTSKEIKTKKT